MRIFRRRRMNNHKTPIGVQLVQKISSKLCSRFPKNRDLWYKCVILGLTYLAYMCYHLTRKPISVVKSVLHRNCSALNYPSNYVLIEGTNESTWCDYPPFDGPDSAALFGTLDSAFLFVYAAAMFGSGFIAERVSLRYFISIGMLFSGIFCYLFGLAKTYNIHSMWYFAFVQIMAGLFQTTGWPGVVTLVSRWFGKSKRGLIFGIWNSHTSIGNILGTVIAAHYVETDWALSFIVPGFIMGVCGFIMFLFLIDSPEDVGIHENTEDDQYKRLESGNASDESENEKSAVIGEQENPSIRSLRGSVNSEVNQRSTERSPILADYRRRNGSPQTDRAIGFVEALKIPGVIEFSVCLFFSKLVSYTFLYWLPLYIMSSANLGASISAYVSTFFDVGGIIGAIAAGSLADYTGMSALTCAIMLIFAMPMLLIYQYWGSISIVFNLVTLVIVGILVNGPYALITTSVSAELGQHSSLEGNSKALATVTAIIDGTGSIGAAVGPLIAGFISINGWENVFHMLVASDALALLFLSKLVVKELDRRRRTNTRIE